MLLFDVNLSQQRLHYYFPRAILRHTRYKRPNSRNSHDLYSKPHNKDTQRKPKNESRFAITTKKRASRSRLTQIIQLHNIQDRRTYSKHSRRHLILGPRPTASLHNTEALPIKRSNLIKASLLRLQMMKSSVL